MSIYIKTKQLKIIHSRIEQILPNLIYLCDITNKIGWQEMNIYLVRHGETAWNEQGLWQGNIDIPLNDTGLLQAKKTTEHLITKLGNKQILKIYTSPLVRALETAELIAASFNSQVIPIYDFREVELGYWEGKHADTITPSKEYMEWEKGEVCCPNGESKRQVYNRSIKTIYNISNSEEHDFIVVTHTMVIYSIICHILSSPISTWNTFAIDNGAITKISYNKSSNRFKVITLNEK